MHMDLSSHHQMLLHLMMRRRVRQINRTGPCRLLFHSQLTSSEKEIHDGEHVAAPKKGRGEGRKEERPFESSILISSSHVLMAIHLSQANSTGRRKQHCGGAVACFGASPLTEQRLG